jgi:uroporphyrinogen-III decarboxylase
VWVEHVGGTCGVCSDILTPLPAFGIDFDIDDDKGPLLDKPITSKEGVRAPSYPYCSAKFSEQRC